MTGNTSSFLKSFSSIFVLFLLVLIIPLLNPIHAFLEMHHVDVRVVIGGNIILLIATAASFYFYSKSLQENRAQALLRNIYAGMYIKLGLCMVSAFMYILIAGKQVNKWGIFIVLGLYLIYTILEISILFNKGKQKNNG